MTRPASSPPAQEIGYVAQPTPNWSYFSSGADINGQTLEEVADLRWPNSTRTYHRMRTDAQIDALIRSVVMPLLRLKWSINPNGARDEVVQDISTQLNLPIQGQTEPFLQRGRKRFNHAEHLRLALLAPTVYGHMFFELAGDIDPTTLAWRLSKLSPRMPQTIAKINVARDGGLIDITQYDSTNWRGLPIPVSQLVAYPWEKEGANWFGRSMLRPLYKHWLLKDRLLRIDAMKNERFGLGIPYGTAAPGGDPAAMQKMAAATRAVEGGGVGLPNGAQMGIAGVSGTLPDTLGSIKYQDEQMARSFLAMFMQLGQTDTGSRALGESFVDFFIDALAGFANWYAGITSQHVIEDIVDWNWGEDEQAPLLAWEESAEEPLSIADLANLAKSGALVLDEELQQWIRKRLNMPDYEGGQPLPTKPSTPFQEYAPGTDIPAQISVNASAAVSIPAVTCPACGSGASEPCVLRNGSTALNWVHQERRVAAAYNPDQPRDTSGRWTPTQQQRGDDIERAELPAGRTPDPAHVRFLGSRGCDGRHVHSAAQTLNYTKVGHRAPTEAEIKAATDFDKMQQDWEAATKTVVDAWGAIRAQQIDALVKDVETAAAAGDPNALATLAAPVLGADTILKYMTSVATLAIAAANQEAVAQGLTAQEVKAADLELEQRANAVAELIARDLAGSAARQAVLRYGTGGDLPAADVAAGVRDQLEALTDAYLNDTLGGAMTQAQNAGRRAVMSAAHTAGTIYYASELLDERTCENCASEDGTSFVTLTDAEVDYPAGGYMACSGGPRCRGTLVAVYGEPTD
ncbi:MAG TPA: hypothetical protein VFT75_18635 [Nocardioidaceae bacterium]|nr:hypothetical protein [Nocardioidaceae bacterium]